MNHQTLEMLRLEHQTMRAELLWRLDGIYDLQKKALPLIVALMVALSWAGAEPNKFPKMPLFVGWLLIPMFFALMITKIKHHRQRNRELSAYIMLIEMAMYGRFPHAVSVGGVSQPGIRFLIGDIGGQPQYIDLSDADVGWEHFIRTYRHLLPRFVDQLEEDNPRLRRLARDCRVPKVIRSMSEIELKYMSWFMIFAVVVSVFQIVGILAGVDLWGLIARDVSNFLATR